LTFQVIRARVQDSQNDSWISRRGRAAAARALLTIVTALAEAKEAGLAPGDVDRRADALWGMKSGPYRRSSCLDLLSRIADQIIDIFSAGASIGSLEVLAHQATPALRRTPEIHGTSAAAPDKAFRVLPLPCLNSRLANR
jgi:hypothetical protein